MEISLCSCNREKTSEGSKLQKVLKARRRTGKLRPSNAMKTVELSEQETTFLWQFRKIIILQSGSFESSVFQIGADYLPSSWLTSYWKLK